LTQYILEYMAGTKGDLLCRFLNGLDSDLWPGRANKTNPPDIGCLNWLKLANPYHLTLDRFEEVLDTNTHKFLPAHPLWVTYDKEYLLLLDEYDYKILKLRYEKNQYITIRIEANLKNGKALDTPAGMNSAPTTAIFGYLVGFLNVMFWKGLDTNSFLSKDLLVIPKATDNENIWKQRAYINELFLSGNNEKREFIDYSDLYLNFNCDILKDYNLDEWKSLVKRSWCDYKENGYMDWDRPYPETMPTTKYSDVIEKWIKENE